MTTRILICAIAASVCCGCMTQYTSHVDRKADGSKVVDRSFTGLAWQKLSTSKLSSDTASDRYERKLSVGEFTTQGDPESIKATGGAVGEAGKAFAQ